jgi:hypothetical protein
MKFKLRIVYWIAFLLIAFALAMLLFEPPRQLGSHYAPDVNRFGPDSVDVQMAMGTLSHDPPYMIGSPPPMKPLLLFPPSQDDLEKLSGPVKTLQ